MSDAFTREPSWAPRLFPPAARAPRAVQTARMLLDPQGYARSLRRRFGPVFSLRTFPYRGALVCAADATANRAVLTDHKRFTGGDAAGLLAPAVGAGSLICTPPPLHLDHRKLLLPPSTGRGSPAGRSGCGSWCTPSCPTCCPATACPYGRGRSG